MSAIIITTPCIIAAVHDNFAVGGGARAPPQRDLPI
jgi:hypothetical protein